jgi:hypothetical protein
MLAASANLAATMEELQQQALSGVAPLTDDLNLQLLDIEEVMS